MGLLLLWSWGDTKGGASSPALGWWSRHSPCHLTPQANGKDGLYHAAALGSLVLFGGITFPAL